MSISIWKSGSPLLMRLVPTGFMFRWVEALRLGITMSRAAAWESRRQALLIPVCSMEVARSAESRMGHSCANLCSGGCAGNGSHALAMGGRSSWSA